MPALSICGVVLPVIVDSLRASFEDVGEASRNVRGHRLLERRRSKWQLDFELSPKPRDEAMLYRSLILGDGEFWAFATNTVYGAKGMPITGTGSTFNGNNPLLAGTWSWRTTVGQTMVVPTRFYTQSPVGGPSRGYAGASIVGWRSDGTNLRCFGWTLKASTTGPTVSREKLGALGSSGATQAYTGGETLAFDVNTGNLTVTAVGTTYWSNLLVIPWALPQTNLDQLLEGFATVRTQLPQLPRVQVMTDLISPDQLLDAPFGVNQNMLICHGEVSDLSVVPLFRNGAFSSTDCTMSGTLYEV